MWRMSASFIALIGGFSSACLYYYYKVGVHHRLVSPFAFHRNRSPNSDGKLFFTSETGILSIRLQGILSYFCVKVDLVNFKYCSPENLSNEKLILIVASMDKDGKLSRSAEVFVQWLSERTQVLNQPKLMEACRFSVLGVQSQVNGERCNALGRDLVRWMSLLGASEILPMREVNQDSEDMEADFTTWCEDLVYKLRDHETVKPQEIVGCPANPFQSDSDDEKKLNADSDEENIFHKYLDYENKLDEYDEDEAGFKQNDDSDDLKETTNPNSGTRQENEQRNVYILVEHAKEGRPKNKTNVLSVASLYRVCLKTEDQAKDADVQPPALPIFNFTSDKYPSGMGCGAIGRKLFFIGGHHHVSNKHSPRVGNSNEMYILDMSLVPESSTEHDISKIIQTKSCIFLNKYDPIVVTVHSKLFVLPNNFGSKKGMNPTIESYDHQKDTWESFDIFQIYKGCGSLKTNPPSSTMYKVRAHSVKDSKIFICLGMEAYAFDVDTGGLYLVGLSSISCGEPFRGMGVYSGGCFFGLHPDKKNLQFYKYNPFLGKSNNHCLLNIRPRVELLSEYNDVNVRGLISNLGENGEENRLLVVRSGQNIVEAQVHGRLVLMFDIFKVTLYESIKGCWIFETYNFTYHVDTRNGPIVDIKACFSIY